MFEYVQPVLLIIIIAYLVWNYYKSKNVRIAEALQRGVDRYNLIQALTFDDSVKRMFANDTVFWELFESKVPPVTARPFLNDIPTYEGKIPSSAVRVLLLYLQEEINPTSGEKT